MVCGLGNVPARRWGRRSLVLSRGLSSSERLKDTWWQGDMSCLRVVLPCSLPAFCPSSVMLGTVGDLRPTPLPQPHQETAAQPSPHSGWSLLTAVLGGKADFSPTEVWWPPGVKWWRLGNAKFHRIPCPLRPSSSAHGLAPGLTLSLIESELSCAAQIYKHTLASSSGTLASWPTSLWLSLWCPAGNEGGAGEVATWTSGRKPSLCQSLCAWSQRCLNPSSLPRLQLPGSRQPFIDLPLPSTRLEVGSKERERDLFKQVLSLLLFLCYLVLAEVCTLWLWILFSPRNYELCSLTISRFINSNGPLTKDLCPLPDLVLLSFGRHPSSVPSSPSRVSWYRDANNCSLAYPPWRSRMKRWVSCSGDSQPPSEFPCQTSCCSPCGSRWKEHAGNVRAAANIS